MKAGGCRDTFVAWEECVEAARNDNDDMVERCHEATANANLKKCMDAHADYYAPLLRAEEAVNESKEKFTSVSNSQGTVSNQISVSRDTANSHTNQAAILEVSRNLEREMEKGTKGGEPRGQDDSATGRKEAADARRSLRPTAARWGPRAAPAAGSPRTMFSSAIGLLFSSHGGLLLESPVPVSCLRNQSIQAGCRCLYQFFIATNV